MGRLQTLQNNGLRICEKIRDPRGVNIQGLHDNLGVSTVETTRNRQLLVQIHRRVQDEEHILLRPRALRGNIKVQLKVPRVKKDIYERSPLWRGQPLWNLLEPATQSQKSVAIFLEELKKLPDAPLRL